MNTAKSENKLHLILILGFLTAIGPLSIDMYLPAFPDIAKSLNTTVASVMLSLSSFFIGISVGQLIYGPLLERFGRKTPLYFGLTIYAIASFGCATAQSVDMLILLRLFQALGGCVGMVAARAMVRDLFEVKDNAKVFSTLMLVVAVSPIIAPTLGGFMTAHFGWRTIFAVLVAIIVLIIAAVFFLLPESKKPDASFSLRPAAIFGNYLGIVKTPQFAVYTFTGAVAYAGLYSYISGSPFVFMVYYHVSEQEYGWIFALVAAGLIGASQVNNLLLKRFASEQIFKVALTIQNLIGLLLVLSIITGWNNIFSSIGLIFCFLCCQGFLFPNASALSMAQFGHNAGSASALMGFIQMSIGALFSAFVSILQTDSPIAMTGVMAFCSLTASLIYSFGKKLIVKKASLLLVEEEEVDMINTL